MRRPFRIYGPLTIEQSVLGTRTIFPESATFLPSWNGKTVPVAIDCLTRTHGLPNPVRHILISPRTWLSIGAFCIGTSFLLGYHLDQRSADRVLAKKVGQPREVLVQDFVPNLHKNMINGIHILGQTIQDECIKVNIGTDSEPRWITVRPIYAVGDALMPLAKQHIRKNHGAIARPMPRSAAGDIRRKRQEIAGISRMALAFAIDEVAATPGPTEGPIAFKVLGEANEERLVEILGSEVTGNSLRKTVSDALLINGTPSVPESLLIAPTAMAAPVPADEPMVKALSWWLALAGASLAIVAMIAPHAADFRLRRARRPLHVQVVEAHGSFPAVGAFQPIASQDELAVDEERALVEKSRGTQFRRRFTRMTEFAVSSFGGIRSPR